MRLFIVFFVATFFANAQDLSQGYIPNDLSAHPMQPLSKPDYLSGVSDPSFPNTTIRRISEALPGGYIKPMYSTMQAWNADETYLILYSNTNGHQLLNGLDYTFIRNLTDVSPDDIETIMWHFTNPQLLYYHESTTNDFIEYNVVTMSKTTIVNFNTVSNCNEGISLGNDIQMMSWDSDVVSFRCGNTSTYYYRISTSTLTQFNITDIAYTAPMPFPSGNLFFHGGNVYDASGNFVRAFNVNGTEHSCLGKLSNGDDAYFAIGFEEGPNGGCQGTLVAHNATNGNCFPVTSYADYGYPQSGTHISSLAHTNAEGGWVAVSMMGFDLDGQDLLDQELFVAKVNATDADVYRVAHHRSDEEDIDYFGEPHVTISPSGTRLLFGSDWSGTEDGISVDSYVAELNAYTLSTSNIERSSVKLYPNPVKDILTVQSQDLVDTNYKIYNIHGTKIMESTIENSSVIDVTELSSGVYFIELNMMNTTSETLKFIKQ
ncbi:T9SS type A sorting domain-containing protein [Winogradskyella sp. R77965]|uniref:T9SS type A sorting domain-containing protein n=1 Tax=Winogradskyella sp. R77965 TaxID=3093872 RepID=UPI0037DD85B6